MVAERRGTKYTGTRMDIVNDFYEEIEKAKSRYADKPDAVAALDEIEEIAVWWANAPAVVQPPETVAAAEAAETIAMLRQLVVDSQRIISEGLEDAEAEARKEAHHQGWNSFRDTLKPRIFDAKTPFDIKSAVEIINTHHYAQQQSEAATAPDIVAAIRHHVNADMDQWELWKFKDRLDNTVYVSIAYHPGDRPEDAFENLDEGNAGSE